MCVLGFLASSISVTFIFFPEHHFLCAMSGSFLTQTPTQGGEPRPEAGHVFLGTKYQIFWKTSSDSPMFGAPPGDSALTCATPRGLKQNPGPGADSGADLKPSTLIPCRR